MEISSKELREVEFRERLRGYDTTEVDEFLERVAIAVDEMHARVRELADRADRAERAEPPPRERPIVDDDDTLRRTLVLAQRTADMAIREAQEEAAQLLDRARAEGESILDKAGESARRLTNDAQRQLQVDVERLTTQRDQLRADVRTLSDLLDNERQRLGEALSSALRWVERSLTASPELASHRSAPLSNEGEDAGDGVESQIEQDAAAALPPRTGALAQKARVQPAVATEDDLDEPEEDEEDDEADLGGGPDAFARMGPQPLRDTQIWQLEDASQDAGWPA